MLSTLLCLSGDTRIVKLCDLWGESIERVLEREFSHFDMLMSQDSRKLKLKSSLFPKLQDIHEALGFFQSSPNRPTLRAYEVSIDSVISVKALLERTAVINEKAALELLVHLKEVAKSGTKLSHVIGETAGLLLDRCRALSGSTEFWKLNLLVHPIEKVDLDIREHLSSNAEVRLLWIRKIFSRSGSPYTKVLNEYEDAISRLQNPEKANLYVAQFFDEVVHNTPGAAFNLWTFSIKMYLAAARVVLNLKHPVIVRILTLIIESSKIAPSSLSSHCSIVSESAPHLLPFHVRLAPY